jgi:AcrR family transcriptional regulator
MLLREAVNRGSLLGAMPYRPTQRTEAKRAATRERIVAAAHGLIARGGYRAASVAAVAARAGVATGSVYRHFPSKAELFAEAFRRASQREVDAVAAHTAQTDPPTPAATRVAGAVETFARRALRGRRLAWALIAEPVDPAVEAERLVFRRAYAEAFASVLRAGVATGELPPQDPELTATALVGAIGEALVGLGGPVSPTSAQLDEDALVAGLVRFCIRSITDQESHVHRHAA